MSRDFVHVDVKYLPKMPDEASRRYLFVGIDRASRRVYLEIMPDKSATSAAKFLKKLTKAAPFRISKVLTDNGKEFTDSFDVHGERTPTGKHLFDMACKTHTIEHRLTKPRHPQTNGMVERFNGRVEELLNQTRFADAKELATTINHYEKLYNSRIPQKMLGHRAPLDALREWRKKCPDLFVKNVYNLAGPDNMTGSAQCRSSTSMANRRLRRSIIVHRQQL